MSTLFIFCLKTKLFEGPEDAELDLVILSPDADPPVVKMMDYSKYRFYHPEKTRRPSPPPRLQIKRPDQPARH
ncbi:BnaC06g02090D [Brassica napus]|uniref:BnaC06g02090D protein n=2 Tax=Brassica napus TaxID=3708 RepID=A0A078HUY7_BRANA|nr:BnaC06g02090D [Brassica napus]